RGYVAMAGNFGYELDLTTLTVEEKEIVKKQIALYKEMRSLIQFGKFYRIINPFDENEAAWSFVSEDQTEMAASYFKILSQPAAAIKTLKF
ncbi:alpha-galactosidase, partial [Paenibacillus sp. EKM208P]